MPRNSLFDGDAQKISEADALIAYLQVLGTLVDFKLYDDKANILQLLSSRLYRRF